MQDKDCGWLRHKFGAWQKPVMNKKHFKLFQVKRCEKCGSGRYRICDREGNKVRNAVIIPESERAQWL